MVYKDKDRQREANKEQMRRARAKGNTSQGNTEGVTTDLPCVTPSGVCEGIVTDKALPVKERTPEETEIHVRLAMENLGMIKTERGNIRVSKPGDADYVPQCETTRAFIEGRPKNTKLPTHKRGKEIKRFEDLPSDVQQTINQMSIVDGKTDHTDKVIRTGIAIRYQHLFPDRFHSTGVAI